MAIVIQDNLQQADIQNRLYASIAAVCEYGERVRKKIALGTPCETEIDNLILLVAMIESTRCYTSLDETWPYGVSGGASNTTGTYNAYSEAELEAVYNVIERWLKIGFPVAGTIWEDDRREKNQVYIVRGLIGNLETSEVGDTGLEYSNSEEFIQDENGNIIYAEVYPLDTEDQYIKYIGDLTAPEGQATWTNGAATTLSAWQTSGKTKVDSPYIIITDRNIAYRGKTA